MNSCGTERRKPETLLRIYQKLLAEDKAMVGQFSMFGSSFDDAWMAAHHGWLNSLEMDGLGLRFTRLTHGSLVHISQMTKLVILRLEGNKFTDAALLLLAGLSNLTRLDISEQGITIQGLLRLVAQLPKLQELNIWGMKLTGEGLKDLHSLDLDTLRANHGGGSTNTGDTGAAWWTVSTGNGYPSGLLPQCVPPREELSDNGTMAQTGYQPRCSCRWWPEPPGQQTKAGGKYPDGVDMDDNGRL
jgi:hypothetical protein